MHFPSRNQKWNEIINLYPYVLHACVICIKSHIKGPSFDLTDTVHHWTNQRWGGFLWSCSACSAWLRRWSSNVRTTTRISPSPRRAGASGRSRPTWISWMWVFTVVVTAVSLSIFHDDQTEDLIVIGRTVVHLSAMASEQSWSVLWMAGR